MNDWLVDFFEADLFQSCQVLANRVFKYKIETSRRSSDRTHQMCPVPLNSHPINITISSSGISIASLSSLSSSFISPPPPPPDHHMAVPLLRRLFACRSPRRPEGQYLGFLVNKVPLLQVCLWVLDFPMSSVHRCSIFFHSSNTDGM